MDKLIEIYNNWYKIEREIKRAKEGREKQERKKPTKQHPIIRLFENKKKTSSNIPMHTFQIDETIKSNVTRNDFELNSVYHLK